MVIARDSLMQREAPLAEGEVVLAEFRADPKIYRQNHIILAAVFALLALAVLWWIGNPHPWTGPLAAVVAVGARAAFLRSEALTDRWRLTPARLLGPGGRVVARSALASARPFFGDVLLVTRAGEKHLMKYIADPAAVIARIGPGREEHP